MVSVSQKVPATDFMCAGAGFPPRKTLKRFVNDALDKVGAGSRGVALLGRSADELSTQYTSPLRRVIDLRLRTASSSHHLRCCGQGSRVRVFLLRPPFWLRPPFGNRYCWSRRQVESSHPTSWPLHVPPGPLHRRSSQCALTGWTWANPFALHYTVGPHKESGRAIPRPCNFSASTSSRFGLRRFRIQSQGFLQLGFTIALPAV